MSNRYTKFSEDAAITALFKEAGAGDKNKAMAAQMEFAKALEGPIRQGVLSGDILGNIFEVIPLAPGATPMYPLDFLAPGTEGDFAAFTMPKQGYIPGKQVEGDYVMVPIYKTAFAMEVMIEYVQDANWYVLGRIAEVMEAAMTKKFNDDGFATLLASGVDRNILVYDSDASSGQLTKRLFSLGKTVFRRNGGGNSSSVNRRRLTDLYTSPEGSESIRNWNVDQVDETTRREIYVADDGSDKLSRIFGVNIHVLDEFGEGQEYQEFYTTQLAGTMPAGDIEIALGLDLARRDSFIMPVRENVQIYVDDNLHRWGRMGWYETYRGGLAVLDNRNTMILSY